MKRFFSAVLVVCIIASFSGIFQSNVFADDFNFTVSISAEEKEVGAVAQNGGRFAGKSLKANITVTSGSSDGVTYEYHWGSNTETGIYSYISSESYVVGNDSMNYKTAFVDVTAYDRNKNALKTVRATQYLDDSGQTAHRKASKEGLNLSTPITDRTVYGETDNKNVFVVGGKRFILLDVFSNENEMFYVMADDTYGKRVFDTGKTSNGDKTLFKTEFDEYTSSGEGNIAYWLNNEFISDEYTGEKLPREIIDNLAEHKYFALKNIWYTTNEETLKVGLLGRLEYIKYIDKFSPVVNSNINDGWWLRDTESCGGNNSKYGPYRVIPNYDIVEGTGSLTASAYIRPTFYLGKSFFENVQIDLLEAGENVRKTLTERYDINTLINIYGLQTLAEAGMIAVPRAENISISGKASENSTVFASYNFVHDGGLTEDGTDLGFEISDNGTDFSKVCSEKEFSIPLGSEGKYLRFFVTPKDTLGVTGETAYSTPVKIGKEKAIIAQNVEINDVFGGPIGDLCDAAVIMPKITMKNNSENDSSVVVLCAVFDKEDKMLCNMVQCILVPANQSAVAEGIELENPAYAEGNYAKILVWDSLLNMNSLYSAEIR